MQEYTNAKAHVKMRILRAAKGWRQFDAAEKIGVALRTYQRWESGESEPYPAMKDKINAMYDRTDVFESRIEIAVEAEKGE